MIACQRCGKTRLIPNNTRIPPVIMLQTKTGTPIKTVVAFKSMVNTSIETARLEITTSGRLRENLDER